MIPTFLTSRRARLGQPKEATQGMIDYWRDQYRDYSKNLNALWDRLRPGFAQVPPAAATSAIPSARPSGVTVEQADARLKELYRDLEQLAWKYAEEADSLRMLRTSGWPGETEARKNQLEADFAAAMARLYARMMEEDRAIRAKIEAVLREKEATIRALTGKVRDGTLSGGEFRWISAEDRAWISSRWTSAQKGRLAEELLRLASRTDDTSVKTWAERAAQTLSPVATPPLTVRPPAPATPRVPASAYQPPPFFDEICTLVRNLEAAELERRARVGRGAPTASVQAAEQEVDRAARAIEDALKGRFESNDAFSNFWLWCRNQRGVRLDWTRWIRTPIVSTISVAPAPATPSPTATGPTIPYGVVMTGTRRVS